MARTDTSRSRLRAALLIVDMINPLDFPEAPSLLQQAIPVVKRISRLKQRLKQRDVPAIYVNDNFTDWLSDFRELVAICSQAGAAGAPLARALAPEHVDFHVLKPSHSGFYAPPLEVLLSQLDIAHVIVCGIAGDGCVLATAADAHIRDFQVSVPSDCCASASKPRNTRALMLMKTSLGIDIRASRVL
jgi:nicotinamidase-related amidase